MSTYFDSADGVGYSHHPHEVERRLARAERVVESLRREVDSIDNGPQSIITGTLARMRKWIEDYDRGAL